jgi:hypothetical protein
MEMYYYKDMYMWYHHRYVQLYIASSTFYDDIIIYNRNPDDYNYDYLYDIIYE